jgi:hypothetical protein
MMSPTAGKEGLRAGNGYDGAVDLAMNATVQVAWMGCNVGRLAVQPDRRERGQPHVCRRPMT